VTGCKARGPHLRRSRPPRLTVTSLLGALLLQAMVGCVWAAGAAGTNAIKVVNGVVMPLRPVTQAITQAMEFLRKADGAYVPGRIDGELAGYFTSAFVLPDGTRSERKLAYPARQHAYFILTFLHYQAYSGDKEWLTRARDLADWNLVHSTPTNALYANLPYSTLAGGKPGGGRDGESIEPDKAAFLGSAYLALYDVTKDEKYLAGARAMADTLARRQRDDGSWPFRVVPGDGRVEQDVGGAPVFFVDFFEAMQSHDGQPSCKAAREKALKYMLRTNVEKNAWGTYHEDIRAKAGDYLSAEPICFTADYLFRKGKEHPEYVEMGRQVLARMEAKLVHTTGHAAAPAPAVAEQAGFNHIMPGHTARYCLALAHLYAVTQDEAVKRKALSGINALTYMQSPTGLFRTFFFSVNRKAADANRLDWYSQHLYTVCHVLEAMPVMPEISRSAGSE
jgi:hypothetical protein